MLVDIIYMLYRLTVPARHGKRPLDVRGGPLDAGHFFPEEIPERTAEELSGFFATTP